jgi:LytS/YehU family sensor histidine kinase
MATFAMTIDRIIVQKNKNEKALLQLERDKNKAELGALKAQIHPHFLFNTLNNLYALTLQKSDKAPETVATLSSMLDYMLYQCKDPFVLLKKEIDFIQDYIDLESLRYGNKLTLNFTHHLHSPDVMIAPLILISFVENAFKHGASKNLNESVIEIELTTNQNQLSFKVFNTLTSNTQNDTKNELRFGIGFSNSQRQLELNYKNNYDLKSTKTDTSFEILLTINLK